MVPTSPMLVLPIIKVKNLVKRFGSCLAVNNLSFEVPTGAFYAFLGVNGAGKSTAISCMTTMARPTSGQVTIGGIDVTRQPMSVRSSIGVVFQDSVLDKRLTVRENLNSCGSLYGIKRKERKQRIQELSEFVDLTDILDRRYGKLSGGQRRRADIARALIHRPRVLFLDEPTTGLDAHNREKVWSCISTMQKKTQTTVFLTTHYLEETESADLVSIINKGKMVAEGDPVTLRQKHTQSVLTVETDDPERFQKECAKRGFKATSLQGRWRIEVEGSQQVLELLNASGSLVKDFEYRRGRMDDVFINVSDEDNE